MLNPLDFLLLLFSGSALFLKLAPRVATVRRSFGVATTLLIVIYVTPLAAWLAWPLENAFPQLSAIEDKNIQYVVHISGAERPTLATSKAAAPLNDQHARYLEAMRLLTLYPKAKLVFAAGRELFAFDDRDIAKELYARAGLSSRLTVIGAAANTWGNANDINDYFDAQDLAQHKEIAVVTSAMHMPRTILSLKSVGVDVIPAPAAPISPRTGFWQSWNAYSARLDNFLVFKRATHEWLGIFYYRIVGRTKALWP